MEKLTGPMNYDHFSEITAKDGIAAERALREYTAKRDKEIEQEFSSDK